MKSQTMPRFIALFAVFQLFASSARAEEHVARVDEKAPSISGIQVVDGNDTVSISLKDVSAYHGHPCPGSTVAFRAIQYGIRLLWGDSVPQRDDVVVLSRGPMYGVLDVFALVTKGPVDPKSDAISQPSRVLKQMRASRDSFAFTMIRRSTGEAVDLRVLPTLYPNDFFVLRKKMRQETASPAELERLKQYQRDLIDAVPRLKESELFELPVQYRVLMFGA